MTGPTEEFFQRLAARGAQAAPVRSAGSIRFDLIHDHDSEHWRVGIDQAGVHVSRDEAAADCVVRIERSLFESVASGQTNAMAAVLRGALVFEGDPEPLVRIQRLFPGPPVGGRS